MRSLAWWMAEFAGNAGIIVSPHSVFLASLDVEVGSSLSDISQVTSKNDQ